MNRFIRHGHLLCVLSVAAALLRCSNPVEQEPFRWRWFGEVPLTDNEFILADEFVNLFAGVTTDTLDTTGSLIIGGTSGTGEIVSFGARADTTVNFVVDHNPLEEERFEEALGPVAITGFGERELPLPLGSPLAWRSDSVFFIRFHATSPPLPLTVTNAGGTALADLEITIADLGTVNAGSVAAGASVQVPFPVAGKTIDSVLTITATDPGAPSPYAVMVAFTFDGLVADSMVVVDHLVQFSKVFENQYEMNDTIDMHYVDVNTGNFVYRLENATQLDLNVTGVHDHVWETNECRIRGVESVDQLAAAFPAQQDSLFYFKGTLTPAGQAIRVLPLSVMQFGALDLNTKRLFPTWRDSISTTRVRYRVTSFPPSGRRVSLSADDRLTFVIIPVTFVLDRLKGTIREAYVQESDTLSIDIPFPWEGASKDSLRGRFVLDSVLAHIDMSVLVEEDAYVDSFDVLLEFADVERSTVVTYRTGFADVHRGKSFRRSIEITDLVNLFPDNIRVYMRTELPVGTGVLVVNDRRAHQNSMTLDMNFTYRLEAFNDYHVTDTASLDLGFGEFDMIGAIRMLRKMEEREVSAIMDVENHTNVYIRLFGLLGPGDARSILDTLSTDSIARLVRRAGIPDGFVNLLGPDGLLIPDRGESHRSTILLDEEQLRAMFDCPTCEKGGWRWYLQFLPKTRDQLLDTNYIAIQSRFRIEGIQNTDSLFIW